VFINPVIDVCVVHIREHNNEPRSPPSNPNHSSDTPPHGTKSDGLVSMRDRACLSFMLTPGLCLVKLATANGAALSSSNNLPPPARPRIDRKNYDHLLPLYDPYGPGLSLSENGDLVRNSLAVASESPTPSQQEAGELPLSYRRNDGNWWEFILRVIRLIFSCFQMRLPSMYFVRVASIIQKSDISMADLVSIKRPGTSKAMMEMITLAGGVSIPNINKVHSMERFKKKWKSFVMRCMEEWRNLNVISALLLRYVSSNIIQ